MSTSITLPNGNRLTKSPPFDPEQNHHLEQVRRLTEQAKQALREAEMHLNSITNEKMAETALQMIDAVRFQHA